MPNILLRRCIPLLSQIPNPPKYHVHKSAVILHPCESDKFIVQPEQKIDSIRATIPEFIWSNIHKWENALAFECAESGRKYTHGEVYKNSRNFATALKQNSLKQGDIVAVILPNMPEFSIACLGILELGLIASPFSPMYTAHEVATQLKTCGAKAIITTPQLLSKVKEAKANCPLVKSIILVGPAEDGCHSFFEMMKVSSQGVDFVKGKDINCVEQTAILSWSSGTTGVPKGVMLTHSNITSNLWQMSQPGVYCIVPFEKGNPQEKFIAVLPLYHIYGFTIIMGGTLVFGAHTVTIPKFDPKVYINTLRNHKPTYLHLVPPLISFLGGNADLSRKDFASVKGMMAAAASSGPAVINSILEKAGDQMLFQEGFGMTETSPLAILTQVKSKNKKLGSCGVPVGGTLLKIMDVNTGEALGPNTPGEICIKGPQVMKGYFNNEKATKETVDSEGWLHSGDIGIYDEENYLYVVDRMKELIKVNGLQVSPSELEDLLREHPKVADVAVIGIPNERAGELPRGYIVPRSPIKEEEIHSYLEKKVAPHKMLKGGIEFVEIIPKSPAGKILRKDIIKDYLAKNKK